MREMYGAAYDGLLEPEGPDAPHLRGTLTPADVLTPLIARA
jgi:hypothetical protein